MNETSNLVAAICSMAVVLVIIGLYLNTIRRNSSKLRKVIFKDNSYIVGRYTLSCWWSDTFNARHIIVVDAGIYGKETTGKKMHYYTNAVKCVVYL